MDRVAELFVRLVLEVGEHDPDYVDAYYGPPAWRDEAKGRKRSLAEIRHSGEAALDDLAKINIPPADPMLQLRRRHLGKQLQSMIARVKILEGAKLPFDEEARALYDADPPHYPEEHFSRILALLSDDLPGEGIPLHRYHEFRKGFIIASPKLPAVFSAAIDEARKRTKAHIPMPAEESFRVEYVTGKPWSGYNWYQGHYSSLIQVNTDLPVFIDRAVDLSCHEGYPGHHVYNVLLEGNLLRKRKWIEFSVYPLFSPQSLIAEGAANYGIDVAFPGKERLQFERDALFPLAGLDPALAEKYHRVSELVTELNFAGNEAARHYLDGTMTAGSALAWLETYSLMEPDRAKQRLRFIDKYRSYVINYNHGLALVKGFIESRAGTDVDSKRRWREFAELLSSPRVPSSLILGNLS